MKKQPTPTIVWENVTSKQASTWLANTFKVPSFENRTPSDQYIIRYAESMREAVIGNLTKTGFRSEAGDPIRLAWDTETELEYVVDGQHRLMALVKSGLPAHPFFMMRYIGSELFKYIDQGKTRDLKTVIDILSKSSQYALWGKTTTGFSSAIYFFYKEHMNGDAAKGAATSLPTAGKMLEWALDNVPLLPVIYDEYEKHFSAIENGQLGAKGMWLYLFNKFYNDDPAAALSVLKFVAHKGRVNKVRSLLAKNQSEGRVDLADERAYELRVLENDAPKAPSIVWNHSITLAMKIRALHSDKDNGKTLGKSSSQAVNKHVPQVFMSAWRLHKKGSPVTMGTLKKQCELMGDFIGLPEQPTTV